MFKHRPKVLVKKAAGVLGIVGTGGAMFWLLSHPNVVNFLIETGLWKEVNILLAGGGTAALVHGLKKYWATRPTIEDFID